MRVLLRKALYGSKTIKYKKSGKGIRLNPKMVIFGSYNGRSYVCSPKAIYEYMISCDEFADWNFVWFFDHPEDYKFLEENRGTKVVKRESPECIKALHEAKYWVFNFRALDNWIPAKEQVYVQCWHGTPLKRLGYDITSSDNAMNSVSEIRQKYRSDAARFDYMVSPCKFVTEAFSSAWNLKAAGKEDAILEIGYPRNDFLRSFTAEDEARVKKALGLENTDKKLILYAPTWRDNQHDAAKGYTYDNPVDFDYLKKELEDEYIILFRAHYLVADKFDFEAYKGFVINVSDYDDINELYIIADMLITDYSSVFFDYGILERPMLFFMYDMEEYRDEMRGFYFDVDQLPGPIFKTEQELVDTIRKAEESFDLGQVKAFNEKYNTWNDGGSSKALVERVMKGSCRENAKKCPLGER